MELDKTINTIILDIYPLMPSTGAWPFTMICIDRNEISPLEMDKPLFAPFQLLVTKRTDFNGKDLLDYVVKSNEFETVDDASKNSLLEKQDKIINDWNEFQQWTDRTTSLAIGLVIQTALYKGLQFSPVETDLSALDLHMGLVPKKLSAYQLFDVYQIDPSFLV
jgi:hypothetical protein